MDIGNELASCILLHALRFVQTFMELDLMPGKGGCDPEKDHGLFQMLLAVWLEWATTNSQYQSLRREEVPCTEAGRRQGGARSHSGASERPRWEVCLRWILAASFAKQQLKTIHLLGEETFQQIWRQKSGVRDGGVWSILPFQSRSLISSGSDCSHTPVSCGFGFRSDSRHSKLVEAGFWHSQQLEGDIFLTKRCSQVL